jgi:hypothetical protein
MIFNFWSGILGPVEGQGITNQDLLTIILVGSDQQIRMIAPNFKENLRKTLMQIVVCR